MNRRRFCKWLGIGPLLATVGWRGVPGGRKHIPGYTYIGDTSRCDVHVMLRVQDNRTGKIYRLGLRLNENEAKAPAVAQAWARKMGSVLSGILMFKRCPRTVEEYEQIEMRGNR